MRWRHDSANGPEPREQTQRDLHLFGRMRKPEGCSQPPVQREVIDAAVYGYFAKVRLAIVGEIRNAEGLEAVRAALRKLFEAFILHRGDSEAAPARQYTDLAFLGRRGEYLIEPVVRDVVIEGYTEKLTPILRREPLHTAVEPQRSIDIARRQRDHFD